MNLTVGIHEEVIGKVDGKKSQTVLRLQLWHISVQFSDTYCVDCQQQLL